MNTRKVMSKNADYQKFIVLKTNRSKRYRYGCFIAEGVRNLNQAVSHGWKIESFIYSSQSKLSDWAGKMLKEVRTEVNFDLAPELLSELSGKSDTSELMAVIRMRDDDFNNLKLSAKPMLALFDRPSNRGNLGTVIRSCDALGIEALILTGHGVDLYDPDVVASSMGSFFSVPVIRIAENDLLDSVIAGLKRKYEGFCVIGTTSHKEKTLSMLDLTLPFMLMIGNEAEGLNMHFKDICDELATIPMAETSTASSLNAACAATVMFYEARRQRGI